MVDITKIQLNPIPPPIIELQTTNNKLEGKNTALRNILIICSVLVGIYIADKIITSIQLENEQKNKSPKV
jgi:hypothetical protein